MRGCAIGQVVTCGLVMWGALYPAAASVQDREVAWADMANSLGTTGRVTVRGRIVEE